MRIKTKKRNVDWFNLKFEDYILDFSMNFFFEIFSILYFQIYKNLGVNDAGHQGFTTQMNTSRMLREIDNEDEMEAKQEGVEVDKKKEEYPVPEGSNIFNMKKQSKIKTNGENRHEYQNIWKF